MIKNKILVVSSNSSMDSGASHSLVKFVSIINSKYDDVQVDVLLPGRGELANVLRKENINYYIIPYSNGLWKKKSDAKMNLLSKYARRANNFIANIRINYLIKKYNIIHINALTTDMGVKYALRKNKKVIWHMREFMEEDLSIEFTNKKNAYRLIGKADMRIAISKSLSKKYELLTSKKVVVVSNGIDIESFYVEKEILKNPEKIKVLLPGRITPEKGQELLIEALRLIKMRGINAYTAIIIGEGDEEYIKELKKRVLNNNLDIQFRNRTDDMLHEYLSADVVCVCSRKEAFGRVTIEGMLTGNLLIGSDSGGTAEIVETMNTGILYKCGNAEDLCEKLLYVKDNSILAKKIAIKGQKMAKKFYSAEQNAENIYACYQRVLDDYANTN